MPGNIEPANLNFILSFLMFGKGLSLILILQFSIILMNIHINYHKNTGHPSLSISVLQSFLFQFFDEWSKNPSNSEQRDKIQQIIANIVLKVNNLRNLNILSGQIFTHTFRGKLSDKNILSKTNHCNNYFLHRNFDEKN